MAMSVVKSGALSITFTLDLMTRQLPTTRGVGRLLSPKLTEANGRFFTGPKLYNFHFACQLERFVIMRVNVSNYILD